MSFSILDVSSLLLFCYISYCRLITIPFELIGSNLRSACCQIIASASLDAEQFKRYFERNKSSDQAKDTAAIVKIEVKRRCDQRGGFIGGNGIN